MHVDTRAALQILATSLVLVASLLLAEVPAASAGVYTVYGCRTPTNAVAPLSGWTDALGDTTSYWQDSCPAATYLWMAASTSHGRGASAEEVFVAPPGTSIQRYTIVRAVRLVPSGGYYYQALQDTSGFWNQVEGCQTYTNCRSIGNYKNPQDGANDFTHGGTSGTTELQLRVICGLSGGCPSESGGVSASVWLFQSRITLQDDSAPQLAGTPSGPLVAGGLLSGIEPVSIGAIDQGGGVYQAAIEIDGKMVQSQVLDDATGTCQQPFTAATPCPLSASGTLNFDTAQLSDGTHSLALVITDAAGNTATWGPMRITTVNSPCSPVPAAAGMTLRASFAGRVKKRVRFVNTVTTSFSDRPVVDGTLTDSAGARIPDAPICVAVRDDYAGAPLKVVRSLRTNGNGGFSYRLGRGPSRRIYFIHRVPSGAIFDAVGINVRAPVRVHINAHRLRNGQVMIWKGTMPGPIPSGMLAVMQVWRGSYWETFQQIHIGRRGDWTGRYRFALTTGVQSYTFRLLVPRQSGYPYAAGASRRIDVTVTG